MVKYLNRVSRSLRNPHLYSFQSKQYCFSGVGVWGCGGEVVSVGMEGRGWALGANDLQIYP